MSSIENLYDSLYDSSYDSAVKQLDSIPQFMNSTGIDRGRKLLEALGHPEKNFKIIHVAGTNGKGSVCAYIERILRENGYSTGLFTSPHLVDVRERICVNGQKVSKEDFLSGYEKVEAAVEENQLEMAYFDYFLGIAAEIFAAEKIDFCILETGLGGRLDATNAVEEKALAVITTISLEHTKILGDTVEKIAAEKAGIIMKGTPLVYSGKNTGAAKVIRRIAENADKPAAENKPEAESKPTAKSKPAIKNKPAAVAFDGVCIEEVLPADCTIIKNTGKSIDFLIHNGYYKNDCFTITTGAIYQVHNCAIALTAVGVLESLGIVRMAKDSVKRAVKDTHWQGRMEEIHKDVYVDGAHNPEAIEAFIESAAVIGRNRKCCLFFSVVNDKNYEEMICRLCGSGIFDAYVVSGIEGSRGLAAERIFEIFEKYTKNPVIVCENAADGFEKALDISRKNNGLCFCTGSLYLVGELKGILSSRAAGQEDI